LRCAKVQPNTLTIELYENELTIIELSYLQYSNQNNKLAD